MSQKRPQAGERYLHFKNKLYQVLTIALHSETGEELVIYQALYGDYRVYARPLAMFTSEVDHRKYPEILQKYRFELVGSLGQEPEEACGEESPKPREASADHEEKGPGQPKGVPEGPAPAVRQAEAQREKRGKQPSIEELLADFYDARSYGDKYKILLEMADGITDVMVDNMAVVLDVVIGEGPLDKRFEELKRCVRTYERYETNRLY